MAYDPADGLINGANLVGGLLQQGRQTQNYVTGMFDAAAKKKAGAAVARGDNQTAAGLIGARGDLEGAAALRRQASTQSSLQAVDAKNFDRAKEEAAAAGDVGMYGTVQQAEDSDRKARIGWLGNAADTLLKVPPEQRHAAFQQFVAPTLKSMGMIDEDIALVDQQSLTDDGLQQFKTTIGDTGSLDVQKLDDGTVIGIDKKSGDVRVLHQGAQKGVVVGGNVVNPVSGDIIYQGPQREKLSEGETLVELGDGGGAGPPAAGGGSGPRNLRNNNPGNIEDGAFAKSLPGYKGSDGRFAIFETPEAGSAAQVALLGSYGRRGIDTVEGIINRWAPPSDNNPTDKYVQFVAQKVGVKPGQKLDMKDPATLSDIAGAIQQFEGGGQSASNGPGGARVLAQGKEKPKRAYTQATPEELRAAGYPPGTRAQKDAETGKFENIKQPTEAEVKATGYANRVLGATDRLNELFTAGLRKPATVTSQLVKEDNGVMRIIARTDKDRQFLQAARDWLAPILRKDTGAAVTDTELATYMDIYIPKFEDSDAVLRQKAKSRTDAVRSLINETGGTFQATYGDRKFKMLMPGEKPAKASEAKAASGKVVKIEVVGD